MASSEHSKIARRPGALRGSVRRVTVSGRSLRPLRASDDRSLDVMLKSRPRPDFGRCSQTKRLPSGEQVFDRRRMPSRATTRRSLVHGLEPGGDLLECVVGRSGLDARDQPNQPAVIRLRKRPSTAIEPHDELTLAHQELMAVARVPHSILPVIFFRGKACRSPFGSSGGPLAVQ
jgi:hypothetical protein